jgi:uncharacterized glyoxalase superfamily protein PhnB
MPKAIPEGLHSVRPELRIGDSAIFCNDTMPEMPQTPRQARLWIYTEGVDRAFERARNVKDMSPVETKKAQDEFVAKMSKK